MISVLCDAFIKSQTYKQLERVSRNILYTKYTKNEMEIMNIAKFNKWFRMQIIFFNLSINYPFINSISELLMKHYW